MNLNFLNLPAGERDLYIEQAAVRRNVSPIMLEKDFWVCWLLGVLFELPFSDQLVFKGGTSLSKVFAVIHRFSEDIDISVSPAFLGLLEREPTSRNQAHNWMRMAEEACAKAVEEQIRVAMDDAVTRVLGTRTLVGRGAWFEYQSDPHTNSPVLLFHYPSSQPDGLAYLQRSVKLEFGSLTDQKPVGRHIVRPWVADVLPQAFTDWRCEVVALEVERSFWEKATILHAEYHRPAGKPAPDRFARHYADTAALAEHPAAAAAVDRLEICQRVSRWKSRFFGSAWSHYELAKPGTFRLVPPRERYMELRRDYDAMRQMYLLEPASFDSILETLSSSRHASMRAARLSQRQTRQEADNYSVDDPPRCSCKSTSPSTQFPESSKCSFIATLFAPTGDAAAHEVPVHGPRLKSDTRHALFATAGDGSCILIRTGCDWRVDARAHCKTYGSHDSTYL